MPQVPRQLRLIDPRIPVTLRLALVYIGISKIGLPNVICQMKTNSLFALMQMEEGQPPSLAGMPGVCVWGGGRTWHFQFGQLSGHWGCCPLGNRPFTKDKLIYAQSFCSKIFGIS
jgi:hypothetical protein